MNCIYTQLLKASNEIRLQNTAKSTLVMKFKSKSVNTFIAQVKAKEPVTDSNDIEFQDWSLNNSHAHFWYCANVSAEILGDPYAKKSPLPGIGPITCLPISPSIPSHQILGQSCLHNRLSLLHISTRRAPLEQHP